MRKETRSATPRDDVKVLNATLRKLQLPGWLWRTGVLAGIVIVWLWICQQILRLGSLIRYDGLEALGPQVVSFMTRINPYLWWGVIVILSLIVLSVTRGWILRSAKRSKATLVSVAEIQALASSLSDEGIQVMKWAWDDTVDPVTIGDLITTRDEIRGGRARKLAMAQAQRQALEQAGKEQSSVRPVRSEPVL